MELIGQAEGRIVLTPAGERILEEARGILSSVEALFPGGGAGLSGRLDVMAPYYLQERLMLPLIRRFREMHPAVAVSLRSGNSMLCRRSLEQRESDIAVTLCFPEWGGVQSFVVGSEVLVLDAPAGCAGREALGGMDFVMVDAPTQGISRGIDGQDDFAGNLLGSLGIRPRSVILADNGVTAERLALALGCATLVGASHVVESEGRVRRSLEDFVSPRRIGVARLANVRHSPAASAFYALASQMLPGLFCESEVPYPAWDPEERGGPGSDG